MKTIMLIFNTSQLRESESNFDTISINSEFIPRILKYQHQVSENNGKMNFQ